MFPQNMTNAVSKKSQSEFFEAQEHFAQLIDDDDEQEAIVYIDSGGYEQDMLLNNDRQVEHDLFYLIVRGKAPMIEYRASEAPTPQFRAHVFQAFIDDRNVFEKPYGMLAVLWRVLRAAPEFYLIILSHIDDRTWRRMTTAVLNDKNHPQHIPDEPFALLVLTCFRWGRHANTLAQQVALENEINLLKLRRYDLDLSRVEPWDTAAQAIESLPADQAPLQVALRGWFRDARRRLCYRDMTSLMLGLVATNLNTEELLQLARFALPCYDEHTIRRIEITRIIERVRAAAIESQRRRTLRNVEPR